MVLIIVVNSANPDLTLSATSDLDLHSLQRSIMEDERH